MFMMIRFQQDGQKYYRKMQLFRMVGKQRPTSNKALKFNLLEMKQDMKAGKPAKIVQKAGKLNRKIIKPTLESAAVTVKMEIIYQFLVKRMTRISIYQQFVHIYSLLFI